MGWTALHFSAEDGHYEVFKFFVDKGISSQLLTNDGSNCLHIAAKQRHVNFCKLLINKYGFDTHVTDKNGCAAFHFAARFGYYETFKLFIDEGIDPHLKINNGMNCLHLAAMYGNSTFCKTLIEKHNMDVQVTDNRGYIMLYYFAEIGRNEFFRSPYLYASQYPHLNKRWKKLSSHCSIKWTFEYLQDAYRKI